MNVTDLLKEVEKLKSDVADTTRGANEAWVTRQKLQDTYQRLILTDLEFALDKKIEQELWNQAFKNQINALQNQSKDKQNAKRGEIQASLNLFLEAASGFYIQLLQEMCCAFNLDLPFRRKSSNIGIIKEYRSSSFSVNPPKKSSCMYVCQHCLVHLGDIARYRQQIDQAQVYYRHAARLVPYNGHPYNQLAILEAAKGNKLSTIFFYVRSIAVKHPFPVAVTNLEKFYTKISKDSHDVRQRLTMSELINAFLQFQSFLYLSTDVGKTKGHMTKILSNLPLHISTSSVSSYQLVQMISINLYAIFHLRRKLSSSGSLPTDDTVKRTITSDHNVNGGNGENTGGISQSMSADSISVDGRVIMDENREMSRSMDSDGSSIKPSKCDLQACHDAALEFTVSFFTVLLQSALKDVINIRQHSAITAIRLAFDWLRCSQADLRNPYLRNQLLWSSIVKLLNVLQDIIVSCNDPDLEIELEKHAKTPLPEDIDLECFLPINKVLSELDFSSVPQRSIDENLEIYLRFRRILSAACCIAEESSMFELLTVNKSHPNALVFKTSLQSESTGVGVVGSRSSASPVTKKTTRQNVAMQAIMQRMKRESPGGSTLTSPEESPHGSLLSDVANKCDLPHNGLPPVRKILTGMTSRRSDVDLLESYNDQNFENSSSGFVSMDKLSQGSAGSGMSAACEFNMLAPPPGAPPPSFDTTTSAHEPVMSSFGSNQHFDQFLIGSRSSHVTMPQPITNLQANAMYPHQGEAYPTQNVHPERVQYMGTGDIRNLFKPIKPQGDNTGGNVIGSHLSNQGVSIPQLSNQGFYNQSMPLGLFTSDINDSGSQPGHNQPAATAHLWLGGRTSEPSNIMAQLGHNVPSTSDHHWLGGRTSEQLNTVAQPGHNLPAHHWPENRASKTSNTIAQPGLNQQATTGWLVEEPGHNQPDTPAHHWLGGRTSETSNTLTSPIPRTSLSNAHNTDMSAQINISGRQQNVLPFLQSSQPHADRNYNQITTDPYASDIMNMVTESISDSMMDLSQKSQLDNLLQNLTARNPASPAQGAVLADSWAAQQQQDQLWSAIQQQLHTQPNPQLLQLQKQMQLQELQQQLQSYQQHVQANQQLQDQLLKESQLQKLQQIYSQQNQQQQFNANPQNLQEQQLLLLQQILNEQHLEELKQKQQQEYSLQYLLTSAAQQLYGRPVYEPTAVGQQKDIAAAAAAALPTGEDLLNLLTSGSRLSSSSSSHSLTNQNRERRGSGHVMQGHMTVEEVERLGFGLSAAENQDLKSFQQASAPIGFPGKRSEDFKTWPAAQHSSAAHTWLQQPQYTQQQQQLLQQLKLEQQQQQKQQELQKQQQLLQQQKQQEQQLLQQQELEKQQQHHWLNQHQQMKQEERIKPEPVEKAYSLFSQSPWSIGVEQKKDDDLAGFPTREGPSIGGLGRSGGVNAAAAGGGWSSKPATVDKQSMWGNVIGQAAVSNPQLYHNNNTATAMTQSMWPDGPSPLEKLLEQQKKQRQTDAR